MKRLFGITNQWLFGCVVTVLLAATLALQPYIDGRGVTDYTHSPTFVSHVSVFLILSVIAFVLGKRQ